MRLMRYLTATSTLVVTAFLALLLFAFSLSVALGADRNAPVSISKGMCGTVLVCEIPKQPLATGP